MSGPGQMSAPSAVLSWTRHRSAVCACWKSRAERACECDFRHACLHTCGEQASVHASHASHASARRRVCERTIACRHSMERGSVYPFGFTTTVRTKSFRK
eukprot:6212275-Pleurochrysis_carterae.AAC.4